MAQKQYTVSLTVGFISADEENCKQDATTFTALLQELFDRFRIKSEEISEQFLSQGPIDVPAEATFGKSLRAATQ